MMFWAALMAASKKAVATLPFLALANVVTIPSIFAPMAAFLGPHALAGIGAALGSAVRFHMLGLKWKDWPREGFFACALGVIFGQVDLPVVGPMLSRVSPEMMPVAQGTAIGILMAAGTGFLSDFIRAYRAKGGAS